MVLFEFMVGLHVRIMYGDCMVVTYYAQNDNFN